MNNATQITLFLSIVVIVLDLVQTPCHISYIIDDEEQCNTEINNTIYL